MTHFQSPTDIDNTLPAKITQFIELKGSVHAKGPPDSSNRQTKVRLTDILPTIRKILGILSTK